MEDWAEIRRLHRSEGVAIKEIARRLGGGEEHGSGRVGVGQPAQVPAAIEGVGRRSVREDDPGPVVEGAADDGAGDRLADQLAVLAVAVEEVADPGRNCQILWMG